jgi:hypothetical protein
MTRDIGAAGGEFAAWLRRGLGRPAVRWQDNTPTAAEHEALLHACTHELRYDVQCENGRAGYLWTLIGVRQESWQRIGGESPPWGKD